jgi:hypothetical protein
MARVHLSNAPVHVIKKVIVPRLKRPKLQLKSNFGMTYTPSANHAASIKIHG